MDCRRGEVAAMKRTRAGRSVGLTHLVMACAVFFAAPSALAQENCPVKPFRWAEDCSGLSGSVLDGIDRLRYISLDDAGSVWLTLGGEYRLKVEMLDAPDFDIKP